MMKLYVFLVLFIILVNKTFAQDSLFAYPLKIDKQRNELVLKYSLTSKNDSSRVDLNKLFKFLQENNYLIVSEKDFEYQVNAANSIEILVGRKETPIKVSFHLQIIKVPTGFNLIINGIYFQNYPSGKKLDKMWIATAEESIIDEVIASKKGKIQKLRQEYKVKTLEFLFNEINKMQGSIN